MKSGKLIGYISFVLILLVFAVYAARFIERTSFVIDGTRHYALFDDAMISMRYARNLAEGHGLVFNPGERVEGYTNFLWVLLAAVAIKLGLDPLLTTRIVGVACALAVMFFCTRFVARSTSSSPILILLVPLLLAANSAFALWSQAGLETMLFTFLVLVGLGEHALGLDRGKGTGGGAPLGGPGGSLMRRSCREGLRVADVYAEENGMPVSIQPGLRSPIGFG